MKDLIFALLHPFLKLYIRVKFRSDYWALKERLQRRPSKPLRLAYEHHFMALGSFVGLGSRIEGKPYFPHGCRGVFISSGATLGKDVIIFQQVTIGSNTLPDSKRPGSPAIGEGCYIGAGAKIIGGITVGHHCRIGANAVVYEDMPPYSVAVCAPTRVLQKDGLDNAFRTVIDGEPYLSRGGRLVRDTAPGEGKVPAGVE